MPDDCKPHHQNPADSPYEPQDDGEQVGTEIPGEQVPLSDAIPENFPGVNLHDPLKVGPNGAIQNLTTQDMENGEV